MIALVLLASSVAASDNVDTAAEHRAKVDSRDGLLLEAARAPGAGTLRLHGGGGASFDRSATSGHTSALWSFHERAAATAGVRLEDRSVAPTFGLRTFLLDQSTYGVNLAVAGSFRAFSMMEGKGSQTEVRLLLGRTFGRVSTTMNLAIAQGLGERRDTDAEASTALSVAVVNSLRLGGEARVRFELADRDIANEGREYEALAGGAAYALLGPMQLQALSGWLAPRGHIAPGPVVLAAAMVDF